MIETLVEREQVWQEIRDQYAQVTKDGLSRMVLLTGPSGIGKTALLDAFLAAYADGPSLRGRAEVLEGGTPYGPIRHGVGVLARTAADERVREAALALLGSLESLGQEEGPDVGLTGRTQVLLKTLAKPSQPAIIVLDDLHEADWDTVKLIVRLLRSTLGPPAFLLLGSRLTDAGNGASVGPIGGLLARTVSDGYSKVLELAPLSHNGVAELGRKVIGAPPTRLLSDYVAQASGGVPFYAERLYRELLNRGNIIVGERSDLVPRSMAALIDEGISMSGALPMLTATEEQVARSLAVLGRCRSADLRWLVDLAGVPEAATRLAVLGLKDAGLLVEKDDGWIEFVHPLLRSFVYSRMAEADAAGLHDQAAEFMRTRPGLIRADPFAYAIHVDRGVAASKRERREAAVAAAEAALMTAPLVTEHWLGKAADTLEVGTPERVRLLTMREEACLLGTATSEGIRIGLQAMEEAGPGADRDEMVFLTKFGLFFAGRHVEGAELSRAEFENDPTNLCNAVTMVSLLDQAGDVEAAALYPAAAELIDCEMENKTVHCAMLSQLELYADLHEMTAERERIYQVLRDTMRHMPPTFAAEAHDALCLKVGSFPGALRQAANEMRAADELRNRHYDTGAWGFREVAAGNISFFQGSWDETLMVVDNSLWVDELGGNILAAQVLRSLGVLVLTNRGQREKALALGSSIRTDGPSLSSGITTLASSRLLDDGAAIKILRPALERQIRNGVGYLLGALANEIYARGKSTLHGRGLLPELLSEALAATVAPLNRMWILHSLGELNQDECQLQEALDLATDEGVPFERARILLSIAELNGDTEASKAAIAGFERLGARPWHAAAVRQAQRLGVRVHLPRVSGNQLSDSESAVVRLVLEGRSNPEIAEQLCLSVKRIESLLTGVFRKLGVASRFQLLSRYGSAGEVIPRR